jgi:hypothetical protein
MALAGYRETVHFLSTIDELHGAGQGEKNDEKPRKSKSRGSCSFLGDLDSAVRARIAASLAADAFVVLLHHYLAALWVCIALLWTYIATSRIAIALLHINSDLVGHGYSHQVMRIASSALFKTRFSQKKTFIEIFK